MTRSNWNYNLQKTQGLENILKFAPRTYSAKSRLCKSNLISLRNTCKEEKREANREGTYKLKRIKSDIKQLKSVDLIWIHKQTKWKYDIYELFGKLHAD